MIAAGFDTSGPRVSIALRGPDGGIREHNYPGLGQVGTTLMPTLLGLCQEASCRAQDIGVLAVSLGPGSFTGLRCGAATANALALALGLKVVGVPSLEVIARSAEPGCERILCLSPHRRGSFYARLFRRAAGHWRAEGVIEVGPLAEIMARLPVAPDVVCGPEEAAVQCEEIGPAGLSPRFLATYPSAAVLIRLAEAKNREAAGRFALPLYVRASQPEEKDKAREPRQR